MIQRSGEGLSAPESVRIALEDGTYVSGLLERPTDAHAVLVLAHGAGAGMTHPFLAAVSTDLAKRNIATIRYQFPYMERSSKRPDPPPRAHVAVRAAVATAAERVHGVSLFAGGKSFGGRMTSQAQSSNPIAGVRGLVFLGFPLHPAREPSQTRGQHLLKIHVPMLFLQGTRDALADLSLLKPLCASLGERATLALFQDADHSFHVPAKSGATDKDVLTRMTETTAAWITARSNSKAGMR